MTVIPGNAKPHIINELIAQRTATPDNTIIYTDNPAVIAWLRKKGIQGKVINRPLTPEDVYGKHLIAGMVPPYIQVVARTYSWISAPHCYIKTATVDQLERAGARLQTYEHYDITNTENPFEGA